MKQAITEYLYKGSSFWVHVPLYIGGTVDLAPGEPSWTLNEPCMDLVWTQAEPKGFMGKNKMDPK